MLFLKMACDGSDIGGVRGDDVVEDTLGMSTVVCACRMDGKERQGTCRTPPYPGPSLYRIVFDFLLDCYEKCRWFLFKALTE
jgi:hypothetical protein